MDSRKLKKTSLLHSVRFALGVTLVYYPILVYVNLPVRNLSFVLTEIPFLVAMGAAYGLLLWAWILLIEQVLDWAFRYVGDVLIVKFKVPILMLVLVSAILSAILFNKTTAFILDFTQRIPDSKQVQALSTTQGIYVSPWELYKRVNAGLNIVIMLSIFYIATNRWAYQLLKDSQVQTERLEKENVQAQFAALKNQVSPHFLFNSLSILSSLVHVDADLSEQFIDQLSRAYRYILEQKDNDRIPLTTELTFIESYTFLLKIRFESGFDVCVNIPPKDANRYQVAPLTLQLLIENAVKHNRMSPEEPLTVYIELESDCLVVRNRLQPRDQFETSTGTGLQNIINRYHLLTDRSLWLGEQRGSFVVKIPLLS